MKGKVGTIGFAGKREWWDVSSFILPSEATGLVQGREPQHHLHSTKHLGLAPTLLRILSQESSLGGSGRQEAAHAGSVGVQSFSAPHVGDTLILCHLEPLPMHTGPIHFSPPADIRAPQLLSEVREGKVISPDVLAYAVQAPQWKQDF